MFRALLALGLTAQAHALSCSHVHTTYDGAYYGDASRDVCPEGSSGKSVHGTNSANSTQSVNLYYCLWENAEGSERVCPSGWTFKSANTYWAMDDFCELNVPVTISDYTVTDCSVNMCPDGYYPISGTCSPCQAGEVYYEGACSPCQAGEVYYEGACVGPMGLVHTAEGWVPHTCTTISESYINSQCCQGC